MDVLLKKLAQNRYKLEKSTRDPWLVKLLMLLQLTQFGLGSEEVT